MPELIDWYAEQLDRTLYELACVLAVVALLPLAGGMLGLIMPLPARLERVADDRLRRVLQLALLSIGWIPAVILVGSFWYGTFTGEISFGWFVDPPTARKRMPLGLVFLHGIGLVGAPLYAAMLVGGLREEQREARARGEAGEGGGTDDADPAA